MASDPKAVAAASGNGLDRVMRVPMEALEQENGKKLLVKLSAENLQHPRAGNLKLTAARPSSPKFPADWGL
jgi:hypothetical protein